MASRRRITAGQVRDIEEVRKTPALLKDWIFVDIGFAPGDASCGVAIGSDKAEEITFGKLVEIVVTEARKPGKPLNLLLEAPLSMAFTKDGNPWPRSFEAKPKKWNRVPRWFEDLKDGEHRGWYRQAGPLTMAGAVRLIWELRRRKRQRKIQLFEGFAPREKGTESQTGDHAKVAEKLRGVVKGETGCPILPPYEIKAAYTSRPAYKYTQLWPITGIEGWDSHKPPKDHTIPPVVWVPPNCQGANPESTDRQCSCAVLRNQVP